MRIYRVHHRGRVDSAGKLVCVMVLPSVMSEFDLEWVILCEFINVRCVAEVSLGK